MITLATLSKATAQEVFERVANHLLTQNKKSTGLDFSCKYRGLNNTKCSVGSLISDDEYKCEFEGMRWHTIVVKYEITQAHLRLIMELQKIHDYIDICNWKCWLITTGKDNNLDTDFLKN